MRKLLTGDLTDRPAGGWRYFAGPLWHGQPEWVAAERFEPGRWLPRRVIADDPRTLSVVIGRIESGQR